MFHLQVVNKIRKEEKIMNSFWKIFFTVILGFIALNIVLDIVGITLHFLFPVLILGGIGYLLYRMWGNSPKRSSATMKTATTGNTFAKKAP